jgi:hypothetical protein
MLSRGEPVAFPALSYPAFAPTIGHDRVRMGLGASAVARGEVYRTALEHQQPGGLPMLAY